MQRLFTGIACLFCSTLAFASACDGSSLGIHNKSNQTLKVTEIDTSGRILFMPSHHTLIENLSVGTVIQPNESVTANVHSVKHSAGGANVHIVLTTDDNQKIEFSGIYKLNLFDDKCHAHVYGKTVKISDPLNYAISNHNHHGKPAILDVRISGG